MEPIIEWSNWMLPQSEGIFLLHPQYPGEPPHNIILEEITLHRFVDSIYVPGRMEDLSPSQVAVVNSLRLRLVAGGYMSDVHTAVKGVFQSALGLIQPPAVLEWGCGYDPMNLRLPLSSRYVAVDLDPAVVEFQKKLRLETYEPLNPSLLSLHASAIDAIISVFVFQFRIPTGHVRIMRQLLADDGVVLANVYRRDGRSRQQLADLFYDEGFSLARTRDVQGLCDDHEYWLMAPDRSDRELSGLLVQLLPHSVNETSLRPQPPPRAGQ